MDSGAYVNTHRALPKLEKETLRVNAALGSNIHPLKDTVAPDRCTALFDPYVRHSAYLKEHAHCAHNGKTRNFPP